MAGAPSQYGIVKFYFEGKQIGEYFDCKSSDGTNLTVNQYEIAADNANLGESPYAPITLSDYITIPTNYHFAGLGEGSNSTTIAYPVGTTFHTDPDKSYAIILEKPTSPIKTLTDSSSTPFAPATYAEAVKCEDGNTLAMKLNNLFTKLGITFSQ